MLYPMRDDDEPEGSCAVRGRQRSALVP